MYIRCYLLPNSTKLYVYIYIYIYKRDVLNISIYYTSKKPMYHFKLLLLKDLSTCTVYLK